MKKRIILSIVIPAVILVLALGLSQVLSPKASYDADFTVTGSVLTKYNGTAKNVTIPDGITEIGAEAFAGNPMIESVAVPNGVSSIGYGAFSNCRNLTSVSLPRSLARVEDSAFNGDEKLTTINFEENLQHLGSGVFGACVSLADVKIKTDNPNFKCEKGSIYSKDGKTLYMYLPGYTGRQYKMPDTVENVKRYAFWGCAYLQDVMLSTGLASIDDMTFANCGSLETVTGYLPINSIGIRAFDTCTSLQQIIVPASVSMIHDTAFNYCDKNLLFVCGEGSYADTYALSNGFQTARSARYLTEYVEEPVVSTVSGNEVQESEKTDDGEQPGSMQEVPNSSVTTVDGDVLFAGKIVSDKVFLILDNMTVNQGVMSDGASPDSGLHTQELSCISDYAYYNRNDLTNVQLSSLSSQLEAIGKLSFARCGLFDVVIPEGVLSIGYGAFYHCDDLATVSIPKSVTSIAAYAFDHTPWMDGWYQDSEASNYLIVGDGVLLAYKGNDAEVILPSSVKRIADNVFRNHTEITSVTFSNGLISIGADSFRGCENLSILHNAGGNIIFEDSSFEGCPVSL